MLYSNCRELPIHNFNECESYRDYKYLIKDEKKHSDEELYAKWGEIYQEYLELLDNDEVRAYYRDKMDVYLAKSKVKQLENLKTAIELLRYLDKDKREQIKETISVISKKMRVTDVNQALEIFSGRLKTKLDDFNRSYNKKDSGLTIDDMIPVLIKQGYPINRNTTTVSEYCKILNAIQKDNKKRQHINSIKK